MSKHEIDIPSLPDGWKPAAFRYGRKGEFGLDKELFEITVDITDYPLIIVEKIQPRRIVLEDTGRYGIPSIGEYALNGEGSFYKCSIPGMWDKKFPIWREVKATDLSLTKDEPKLSLSADECRELIEFGGFAMDKIRAFIKERNNGN